MTAFALRPTTAADAEGVTALLQASYGSLLRSHYPDALLAAALPLMARARPDLLTSGTYFVGVRPQDGALVGCGGWTRHGPLGDQVAGRAHLRHFATSPGCVRSGVGGSILQRCLDEIRVAGLTNIECVSTLMAEPFYARAGFRRVGNADVVFGEGVVFPVVKMLLRC